MPIINISVEQVATMLKQIIIKRMNLPDDSAVREAQRLFRRDPSRAVADDPDIATLVDAHDILRHGSRNRW